MGLIIREGGFLCRNFKFAAKETPSAFLRQPIVTTGRFVAFAPHVTRGLQTAIVSGVRHNSSSLASALNGETILQRKRLRCF